VRSAEPNTPAAPVQILCPDGAATAAVIGAAENILRRMHFAIEKLDVQQGLVKTRPLRGAQVFEFWRTDNASALGCAEANVQSIRRTVQLRVRTEGRGQRTEDGGQKTEQGDAAQLRVECAVSVQRLSLPEDEIVGTSEAYRLHLGISPAWQRIGVGPQPRRRMTWIDLGEDRDLAARILAHVEQRLQRRD
jgi:hypothetical protein